jgi:hypothetical protein
MTKKPKHKIAMKTFQKDIPRKLILYGCNISIPRCVHLRFGY